MAANCVTKQQKRSPEYIGAMEKLDISSSVLELLLFEYQSLPENEEAFSKDELPFPSIEYLQGQLYAPAITVLDGSIIEYYDKQLNDKTFTAKTLQEAKNIAHVIGKRIGHNSVRVVETKNGQYKVLTTRPKLDASVEIEKILSNAPRDEQGRLLAPNGKPSNLTERQYAQVRTKAFMDWFGDWINAPENASKVVDENGEPMVVYHTGDNWHDINTFKTTQELTISKDEEWVTNKDLNNYRQEGYEITSAQEEAYLNGEYIVISRPNAPYFASNIKVSKTYGAHRVFEEEGRFVGTLYPVFLNIKDGVVISGNNAVWNNILHDGKHVTTRDLETIYRNKTEGLIIKNIYDFGSNILDGEAVTFDKEWLSDVFIVYSPNQIKSATDNIGTFSRESNNIYYNIVRNTNPKENLLITLRQEKLIHRHDTGDRYVLTLNADIKQGSQNDIDSVTRRRLIQQATDKVYLRLESLGFPKNTINITDTKSGGTAYVDINETVLSQIKDAVSLGAKIQDIKAIYDLADFLGEKFGVKFGGIISQTQANQMTNNANPNAFIQNNTVYVVANKVTIDTIAEEFLHPFVNTLYKDSPKVFKQLYDEAVALFPNLKTQIYSNYRGRENHKFTATDLMQELVAQALSRHFREEYEQSLLNGPLTVQETLKKMDESENFFTKAWNAIKRLFKELQDKLIGEKYVFEGNDLKNLSLRQVAKLINTSDSSFWTLHDTKTRFSLSEERLPISENNKDTIIERPVFLDEYNNPIILSSELSSFLKDIEFFNTTKFTSVAPDTSISIPYSDWKKALTISEALDGDVTNIINEFIHIYGSADGLFEYNKETKLYKIPYHYAVAIRLLNKYPKLSTLLVKEYNKLDDREFENIISAIGANPDVFSLIESLLKSVGVKYLYIDKSQLEINFENSENTYTQESSDKGSTSAVINYTDPLGDAIESLLGIDSIMYRDEVEELAHKVCIKISDTLTKIQNDPSIVEVITNGRVKGTPEMSRMSRNKLLQTVGVNDIVNYIKELTFGSGNDTIADDMFEMADLLYNNFNTLVSFGMSTFAATEGFSFSLSENTVTVTEDNSSIEDVDEAELSENEGSRQEAWQVESVTKSVIDRMALDVKAELQRCKVLDENGNEVVDRWGLSDNIPLQQATQTILTVTRGSFTLSDMIAKMEKGVKTYPWLQLLLPKLKDKSGQYSSFQSQFYNAMQSHFQLYSVVVNENGKIATKPVNKDTALTAAKRSIVALYNIRQHPLFDSKGAVNKLSLETLKTNLEQLKSKDVEDKLPIVQEVLTILGYDNTDSDFLASIVNDDVVKEISNSLHYIIKGLESHKDDKIITWKPFSADPKDKGIINNISKVIKPFTDVTIDATLSSFHADGKMYQSNKIPSYLTKLFLKFGELSNTVQSATELTPYYKFLQEEYGCTEWFRDNSEDLGVEVNLEMQKGWKLPWLQMLASDPKAREIFAHKVDISFDKKGYMKSSTGKYMNELEYALMALGEYFSETTSENNLADKVPAWFRVAMQSNKPSADFIRFYSYRGQNYKDAIVKDLLEIFNQELSRMQTCTMRKKEIAKDKSIEISSFDKNGTKFCFLDFLELKRKDTDFGKLVEKKINGEEVNEAELLSQAELLIRESMEQRVAEMLTEFEANGIIQQASKVKGIDTSNIKEGIENFLWNDFLASINILELTITDVANYKNAEDLQKRLAQIHAPGNRPNIEATDLEGNKVTDGTYRTIILEDFEGFKSNVVENLRYVFDLELAKLSDDNPNKAAAKATYDRIIEQFEKEVNVTDALGYSCPTSYRKKALMFGRWSKRHEAIYQKLLKGESTLTDIEEAFGPLKPFVYSNTTRSSYAENAPIKNLKVGVLYKNSEYMLVMADALIRRVSNGRPNLLKAIFKVMEDSYKKDVTKGLDTIQFKSSMKTGISGVLSLNDLVDDPDGYNKAVKRLEDAIYDKNGKDGYNAKHVHASPFEDYCIQQEVPPHFKNHHQAHGSQTRAIIPSDLDPNATYKVKINDLEYYEYTAQELIEEYESLISENIKDSYTDLYRELEWNKDNQYTEEGKANLKRHLSEILKRELLSSQRHSLDLFYACTLRDGDFRVPLGDAVQSNKVEQLINSIIKNRINKQEIAGGPVVQASSFGLSKQLNMVFKDSKGNRLKTLKEFGGTEELYKQYLKDHQSSFSHMEVYAPIYDERLLEFLNADGTIDIKAIEKLNPELLDLVAYRIPTEDKYSIIPCKIVGFVPREAGEVIMMPEEITLLTGSDFDIDKMYLMRKEFDIKKKTQELIIQTVQEWYKQNKDTAPSEDLLINFLEELKEHPYATRKKHPTVWKAYKESAYETSLPKDLRAVRNNKIIDITLSVLSHPSTTALQMTPGGFDEQRKVGYMVEAYKLGKGTWELLEKMSINLLKDLCYISKNLCFFDTQMQFYKLNSAAGSILAIFAVAKVAHAIFQTRHIEIDVKKAMGIKQKGKFSIQLGNSKLTPMMRLDATFNDNGQYIGKVLGEMVASSADAVKDPVLNLMNINVETVNILNSLIRLGIPFKTAAMFLSSEAISNALNDYYKESLTLNISFTQVIKNKLKELHQENNISWISEGLTNEELLDAIKGGDPKLDIKVLQMFLSISNLASSVQKASFITRFNSMSSAVGPLVIDNLITEIKLHDFPLETIYLKKNGELVDLSALSMLNEFPILDAFKQTLTLSNAIFGEDIITNSRGFRRMITSLSSTILKTLMSDRNAFCKLGDFYKSAMLIHSGVFNSEDLKYYIHDFPKEFIVLNFKEKFPENKFVQLLKYNVEKGSERLSLGIELTGMDKRDLGRITAAWLDLYKSNEEGKKLAIDLVKYFFFKGGIGFSPKTPLHLLPVLLRLVIPGYMDAFGKKRVLPNETLVYLQFVQNYWQNNKIAPIKKVKLQDEGDGLFSTEDIPMHLERTYFKMKNSEGQFDLYYVVAATKDYANVVKIPKLGNNGEYIEINQLDLAPMESTVSNELEIEDETKVIEVGTTSPQLKEEEPIEVQDDAVSIKDKLETFLNGVQKERVAQLKDMSKEEQQSRKNATLAWMKRILKQHGIEVSELNLEKTFELYC